MKRIFTAVLALLLLLSACGKEPESASAAQSGQSRPSSALEVLEKTWALYGEEERFSVMGGDMDNAVDGKPGSYSMENKENLQYDVLIPAELLEYVDTAATMVHMMNRNTFTCAAMTLNTGMALEDFAQTLRDGIQEQQWMCGFPDMLFVASPAEGMVVMAFGMAESMRYFYNHFMEAWPGATVLYDESIGG